MPLWFRMTVENTSAITSIRCPLWTIIGTAYFRFLQGLLLWNKSGQSNLNRGGCFHCISGALGSASEFQEEAQCLTSSQSGEQSRCFTVKSQICFFTSLCGLWVKPRVTTLCVIHGENQLQTRQFSLEKFKFLSDIRVLLVYNRWLWLPTLLYHVYLISGVTEDQGNPRWHSSVCNIHLVMRKFVALVVWRITPHAWETVMIPDHQAG